MTNNESESKNISPQENPNTQKWMENLNLGLNKYNIELSKYLNHTNNQIGGTITALNSTLQDLDQVSFSKIEPNVNAQIAKNLEPYRADLDSLKIQLQAVKNSLEPLGKFIQENLTFLSNSIAVQGKLQVIDSAISSLYRRLEILENDKNQGWNKRATIINIICTLLGVGITFLGVVVAFWLGAFK
jgi:hypothetical protein